MATNDFKPFATGAGANVTAQAEWASLPTLFTGFQSGKASSAQVNKAIRQASFISAALAQYVTNKTGQNVLDDGDMAGFIAKLVSGLGKDFQPTDATLTNLSGKSVAGLLSYLGLGEAAKRDVGAGQNQIPDMSAFASDLRNIGLQRLPGGLILQWGNAAPGTGGDVTVNYPVAYSKRPFFIGMGYRQSSSPTVMQSIVMNDQIVNNIGFVARCFQYQDGQVKAGESAFFWYALGV
ncbi:phage tail protein [Pseudescherichia sp.]|uniref:gp53-like domain-containing protein n=1 Tax=Pseudescherichia sp. TaxID=2055881 RepID=UPI002898F639|nr:phage tail protein [Pseudescherichia sp.]